MTTPLQKAFDTAISNINACIIWWCEYLTTWNDLPGDRAARIAAHIKYLKQAATELESMKEMYK